MKLGNSSLFAICVAIWGSTWLAITYQLGSVAPEISVGYRFLLAGLVLFAYCRWRGIALRFGRAEHIEMLLTGIGMYCVSYIFVYKAETYIISGMVAVGYSASPMLSMLASRLFYGTPMTRPVIGGSVLGIAGIVLVFWNEFAQVGSSRNAMLGAALTMLSVLISTGGTMMAMRLQRRKLPIWPSMAWSMFYGGALALLIGIASGAPLAFEASTAYVGTLLYLTLAGSIITFACYLTLVARIGAAPASYIGVMTPVVALLVSAVFENMAWGLLTLMGIALLVAGNVFMLRAKPAAKVQPPAQPGRG
ncbi:MAG TPA: EamA family transporter [Usitatibacteraceae bacterium]|nr:EamA family transporter [Usitatibacteraceae bacterium]